MSAIAIDQILKLVEQLDTPDRIILFEKLRSLVAPERQAILMERQRRIETGEMAESIKLPSLRGKYAGAELSEQAIKAILRDASSAWEEDQHD